LSLTPVILSPQAKNLSPASEIAKQTTTLWRTILHFIQDDGVSTAG